jgi:hypothetical protein
MKKSFKFIIMSFVNIAFLSSSLVHAEPKKIKFELPQNSCVSYVGPINDKSELLDGRVGCHINYRLIEDKANVADRQFYTGEDVEWSHFWAGWFAGEGGAISLFLAFPVVAVAFSPLAHAIEKSGLMDVCEEVRTGLIERKCVDAIIDTKQPYEIIEVK